MTYITVVIDTSAHPRGGNNNPAVDYVNSPNYPKSWATRDDGSYLAYDSSGSDIYTRLDGPTSIDRRLILICCLAFLGCLLLVVFGAVLIRFKRRGARDSSSPVTNATHFIHPKMAKYRAATLQPQPTPTTAIVSSHLSVASKDTSRYVYGWSAQRSPMVGAGYGTAEVSASAQNQKVMPPCGQQHHKLHHQQQDQLLRMGYVTNAPATGYFENVTQVRPSQGELTLQVHTIKFYLSDPTNQNPM